MPKYHDMNRKIRLKVRQAVCTKCPMSGFVDHPGQDICITGSGPEDADVMVLTKMPSSKKYHELVCNQLKANNIDPKKVYFTGAIKCISFQRKPRRKDVRACTQNYLDQEIDLIEPKFILALGNEALQATANHSGITKYRGKIFEYRGAKVFPTVSPAMVLRTPRYMKGWKADIAFFGNLVHGKGQTQQKTQYHTIDSKDKLQKLLAYIDNAEVVSYDVETTGFEEFLPHSAIVSLSLTLSGPKFNLITCVIPLYHPESVWRKNWTKVLEVVGRHLVEVKKQIAHNGKFDDRWLRAFGVYTTCTFDTMLAAHVLDENRSQKLKDLARTLLGAPAWDIDTKNLLQTPVDTVLEYNAQDTYWTYKLYEHLREKLLDRERLLRLFMFLLMPSSKLLTRAERRGIWVDRQRLASATKISYDELESINDQLMQWVPDELPEDLPTNKRRKGDGEYEQVNFNPSNFARWWLFEYLDLPVLKRGKKKPDGSPGDPSMAEGVLLRLRGKHPAVELMLERSTWQKITSAFMDPYNDLITEDDRIHTTFKLHGTVTGRLSSGKEDAEKVTAKVQRRGVNLQQVPRKKLIRGIFGAPPGWAFVEADFSQIELRVVAFLSRDPTMLRLYQTGQDIHTATAAWVLDMPASEVGKKDRKKAKSVNFGFVYGMGAKKFVKTAFEDYDLEFSLSQAKNMRRAFFEKYSKLPEWHAKQRQLARKYKRVLSPLGRIRRLPDIKSSNRGVKHMAERQAINAPVQAFASDLTQLSMVRIDKQFKKQGIRGHIVGSIHDANLLEIHRDDLDAALPLVKDTMENLPLKRQFGVTLDVPIIADIALGTHWGEAEELPAEEVYDLTRERVDELLSRDIE